MWGEWGVCACRLKQAEPTFRWRSQLNNDSCVNFAVQQQSRERLPETPPPPTHRLAPPTFSVFVTFVPLTPSKHLSGMSCHRCALHAFALGLAGTQEFTSALRVRNAHTR